MSVTKRMWEQGVGVRLSKQQRQEAEGERMTAIASVFTTLKPYHLAFIKRYRGFKKSQIYKKLYADNWRAPSQSKFYQDIKKVTGINEYLTHYFYTHTKQCLEDFNLPLEKVGALVDKTSDANRYVLSGHL